MPTFEHENSAFPRQDSSMKFLLAAVDREPGRRIRGQLVCLARHARSGHASSAARAPWDRGAQCAWPDGWNTRHRWHGRHDGFGAAVRRGAGEVFRCPVRTAPCHVRGRQLRRGGGQPGMAGSGTAQFWLAAASVLNIGIALFCTLALALHARDIPARLRRLVWRALTRRALSAPGFFLFFPPGEEAAKPVIADGPDEDEKPPKMRRR